MGLQQAKEALGLNEQERVIYEAIFAAAENDLVCPNYLDLNEVAGYESASSSPSVVKRLEIKGLIRVVRYQRFRRVQIVATGKWTARHPSMHVERLHVPRGARRSVATDRKPYKEGL